MDTKDVLLRLRGAVTRAGSQAKFARNCGVSPQYVGQVLRGDRMPSDSILSALGLAREVTIKAKRSA